MHQKFVVTSSSDRFDGKTWRNLLTLEDEFKWNIRELKEQMSVDHSFITCMQIVPVNITNQTKPTLAITLVQNFSNNFVFDKE